MLNRLSTYHWCGHRGHWLANRVQTEAHALCIEALVLARLRQDVLCLHGRQVRGRRPYLRTADFRILRQELSLRDVNKAD